MEHSLGGAQVQKQCLCRLNKDSTRQMAKFSPGEV